MVQWLRLSASNAMDMGLIPGWGTRIPHIDNDDKSMTPKLEDEHHLLLRNYVSMDQNSGKGESILDFIPQDLSF